MLAFSALNSNPKTTPHAADGQNHGSKATPNAAGTSAAKEMTEGEVRKVDRESKTVTLKYGPIKNLEIPSMTMAFQVRDEKLFDKPAAGEKITISAEQLQGALCSQVLEKG